MFKVMTNDMMYVAVILDAIFAFLFFIYRIVKYTSQIS